MKMSRKMKSKGNKKVSDYSYVEKNIYKTGNSYRVRVGHFSVYTDTLTSAKKSKKRFHQYMSSEAKVY